MLVDKECMPEKKGDCARTVGLNKLIDTQGTQVNTKGSSSIVDFYMPGHNLDS